MFGGSGIMGLEALSRGFDKVRVFEKNRTVAEIIKSNYKTLGIDPDIYIGDSLNLIKKQTEKFDVIYIDPPYESGVYEDVLAYIKTCACFDETVIITEINSEIDFDGFEVIKQKKYGDKYISFIKILKR
jgi:16S rRNA (guanine966-N2)-methyltransferase